MKAVVQIIFGVSAFASSALAIAPILIGQFGPWTVSGNPQMLPQPGEPMPPGGFLAYTRGQGDIIHNLSSQGDDLEFQTFGSNHECSQISHHRLSDFFARRAEIGVEFLRQTTAVISCQKLDRTKAAMEVRYASEANRYLPKITAIFFGEVKK